MALPQVVLPTYELEIPSNGKKIKYRPFVVKEEKLLLLALESEDSKHIENAVKQLLKGCETLISVKIAEYDDLIFEVQKEILSAKEEILIRVWSDEFVKIEEQLRKVEAKGINIQLLFFTPLSEPIGRTFSYNIDPNAFKENWKRGIALSIDNKKV